MMPLRLVGYINNSLHLTRKMLVYLSSDIICFCESIFYRVYFESQMEAFVLIILRIFFATRADPKTEEYYQIFPILSWAIFGQYHYTLTKLAIPLTTSV